MLTLLRTVNKIFQHRSNFIYNFRLLHKSRQERNFPREFWADVRLRESFSHLRALKIVLYCRFSFIFSSVFCCTSSASFQIEEREVKSQVNKILL